MKHREQISRIVAGLAEYYDKHLSVSQLAMYVEDLAGMDLERLAQAVREYRADPKNDRFPLPAKLRALDRSEDMHPGADEAWAMISHDERDTFVWTDEMAEAFGQSRHLLMEGDKFSAKRAFDQIYQRLVSEARAQHKPARWVPSLGLDVTQRDRAIQEAAKLGRISQSSASQLLPPPQIPKQLSGPDEAPEPTLVHSHIQEILAKIQKVGT